MVEENRDGQKQRQINGFCYAWLFGLITGMAVFGAIFAIITLK